MMMSTKEHRAYCIYVAHHLTLQEMGARKEEFDLPSYHTLKAWSRKNDWKNKRKEVYAMQDEIEALKAQLEILLKHVLSIHYIANNG